MSKLWKNLVLGLGMVVFFNPLFADWVCDSSCNLSISFADGGNISTDGSVQFLFGSGGFVNHGEVSTGYAEGELLVLDAGDSLEFGVGGQMSLGASGNLDFSSLRIEGGHIQFNDVQGNGHVIFNGQLTLASSELDVSGVLEITLGAGLLLEMQSEALDSNPQWSSCSEMASLTIAVVSVESCFGYVLPSIDLSVSASNFNMGYTDLGGQQIEFTINSVIDGGSFLITSDPAGNGGSFSLWLIYVLLYALLIPRSIDWAFVT